MEMTYPEWRRTIIEKCSYGSGRAMHTGSSGARCMVRKSVTVCRLGMNGGQNSDTIFSVNGNGMVRK